MTTADAQAEAPANELDFFPFDELLSMNFPVSEEFADGGAPLYVSGWFLPELTVCWQCVLDNFGATVLIPNKAAGDTDFYEFPCVFTGQSEAEAWFRAHVGNPDGLKDVQDFLRAGFQRAE